MTPLLTAAQVAAWFHVSRGWVFDHASGRRRPKLPSIKLGKALRFREEEVNRWLEVLSGRQAA
jgi:predicted DNA-binding transcriptional regulator AlpA